VAPRTHYARSGEHNIAYQVYGDGPVDVLQVLGGLSHLEVLWEEPGVARLFDRLGSFARVVLMDRRGLGMSDPIVGRVSLEDEVEDINAVLDAVGVESAALYGHTTGAPFVIQYAAKYPERVRALVLYAAFARVTRADDMPWADTEEERAERVARTLEHWGEGSNAALNAPSARGDAGLHGWFARLERMAASPGQMRQVLELLGEVDVRHLLAELRVPTLILHRKDDQAFDVRHSRYLAERIPGARYVELPGVDSLPFVGDVEAYVGEIEEFLTGGRASRQPDRELLTVLFTDICDGTARAAELGDGRWRDLLAAHDAEVRRQLERFGGNEVKTIGDGFLAVFAGPPSPAVRCARAIVEAAGRVGVDVRAGLHTGECEVIGDDIGGMAVHIAARVSALAGPGEVMASGTTYGTVVGSGLPFESAGMRALKGVPGEWPLFRVR
jgi:class 3 adenylate cyclase/pimeloyl-ACP methyl ester carboxylesterase